MATSFSKALPVCVKLGSTSSKLPLRPLARPAIPNAGTARTPQSPALPVPSSGNLLAWITNLENSPATASPTTSNSSASASTQPARMSTSSARIAPTTPSPKSATASPALTTDLCSKEDVSARPHSSRMLRALAHHAAVAASSAPMLTPASAAPSRPLPMETGPTPAPSGLCSPNLLEPSSAGTALLPALHAMAPLINA